MEDRGEAEREWWVYMLRCGDGSLYTGVALDVDARLEQHRTGRGARYTRGRGPLKLVFMERVSGHGRALRREAAIKGMTRHNKERLLRSPANLL